MGDRRIIRKVRKTVKNPDAIIDLYDLTFVWVSELTSQLTRFSREELMGEQIFIVCPRYESPEKLGVNLLYDFKTEKEIPIIKKNKKRSTLKVLSTGISIDGTPLGILKIISIPSKKPD